MKNKRSIYLFFVITIISIIFVAGCTVPMNQKSADNNTQKDESISSETNEEYDALSKSASIGERNWMMLDTVPDNTRVKGIQYGFFNINQSLIDLIKSNKIYVDSAYIEFTITDDNNELTGADLRSGNYSAYNTAHAKIVYYYDHKDTALIHMPNNRTYSKLMSNYVPTRGMTAINIWQDDYSHNLPAYIKSSEYNKCDTKSYRRKRRVKDRVFGPDDYREDFGYKKTVTKRYYLSPEQILLMYKNKKYGYVACSALETSRNKSNNSAPSWLKNRWVTKEIITDFRLVSAKLYVKTKNK